MRSWQALLVIIVLFVFAVSSGWHIIYIFAYVLLVLLLLSWFWTHYSLRYLVLQRFVTGNRLQVGEIFDERLLLENTSFLPKLWIQIVDQSTLPGHHADYVASMGGHRRLQWHVRSMCRLRGRFSLGPVLGTSGDPFGLFRKRIALGTPREILVLPQVLPIRNFAPFSGGLPSQGTSSRRAMHATTSATAIREYVVGDALNHIHWGSSAHHNKLMVKEFDLDPIVDAWVFLDLQDAVQAGSGEHSTLEYGVTVAATIATYLLRQGLSIGLVINAQQREFLSPDRGDRQTERVLEVLAVVEAGPSPELKEALISDAAIFGRNTALIVITPSNLQNWHEDVLLVKRRGVQVAVVGLDAASFTSLPRTEDTLTPLESIGIPVVRIKCGELVPRAFEVTAETR